MTQTIRVSLPGYDALTDTNLDHFALHADQDNVLIKEYTRGAGTIAGSGGVQTITHNFGYVPFFLVYVNYDSPFESNVWTLVPATNKSLSVPTFLAQSDTNILTITNNDGTVHKFNWYVFYDNFTTNAGSFTPSNQAARVSVTGQDAGTSVNPNAYIFHSDLNTFKIISEGSTTLNYTSGTAGTTFSFNHNSGLGTPSSYAVFMKFPDGKTALLPGFGFLYSRDNSYRVHDTVIDATQISFTLENLSGPGTANFPIKYYIFETPLGTI